MSKFAVALFLLLAAIGNAFAQSVHVIDEDRGGRIGTYIDRYSVWRSSNDEVRVRGLCASACTILLSAIPKKRLCVTAKATFGFHAAWDLGERGQVVASPEATQMLYAMYPRSVRRWITANGGLTPHMIFAKGTALGYRRCEPDRKTFAQKF